MKIHLPTYPQGIHDIQQDLLPAELDLDPQLFTHPIHAAIRLDRHDPYFEFRIKLETTANAECDRCLSECAVPIQAQAPMLYVAGHPPKGDTVDDEGIVYIKPGTIELDLTADLRDFLILSYSGKHLCSEECKGLCATCGSNQNDGPCNCSNS
ncbi:MAG: DUF177 domain-containing protein [bacterium]|nr:DUF177 domain-containing protein [bacterium]